MRIKILFFVSILLLYVNFLQAANQSEKRDFDVAICLDLSGSSNGLLNAFRTHYWEMMADFQNYSPAINYRVAIVLYGRQGFGKENHFVYVLSDFSRNFEKVMTELSEMIPMVEGGSARPGRVLNKCISDLKWSKNEDAVKTILIIGNGSPNNGNIKYLDIVEEAQRKGININGIYNQVGTEPKLYKDLWKDLSTVNNGEYHEITLVENKILFYEQYQNELFDEIAAIVNRTYLPYGENGKKQFQKMVALDSLSKFGGQNNYSARIVYKSSEDFQKTNEDWDLVDYYWKYGELPKKLLFSELPKKYQQMSEKALIKELEFMISVRDVCVESLQKLKRERLADLNRRFSKLEKFTTNETIDIAIVSCIRSTARKQGFNVNF